MMKLAIPLLCLACSAFAINYTNSTAIQLQTSLTNSAIVAGDTIWLRGGIYLPPYTNASLTGTNAPGGTRAWSVSILGATNNLITIRSYPGELAKIDRPWRFGTANFLRFRDIEFYDSLRGFVPGVAGASGRGWLHFDDSMVVGEHEWINCIVHDVNNVWGGGTAGHSIRGCIVFHVGNAASDHICYPSPSEFLGNICAWWPRDAMNNQERSLICRSNIWFGGGQVTGESPRDFNLISNPSDVSIFAENYVYNKFSTDNPGTSLLFDGGWFGISNNVIVAPGIAVNIGFGGVGSASIFNNTMHMNQGFANYPIMKRAYTNGTYTINSNHYTAQSGREVRFEYTNVSMTFPEWKAAFPTFDTTSTSTNGANPPDEIYVIPNHDQAKRAHIAVFNFRGSNNLSANLSAVLTSGDTYDLYSAQKYGTPILSGTFGGSTISLPMTNLNVAVAANAGTNVFLVPPVTSPEFAAFIIVSPSTQPIGSINVGTLNVGTTTVVPP